MALPHLAEAQITKKTQSPKATATPGAKKPVAKKEVQANKKTPQKTRAPEKPNKKATAKPKKTTVVQPPLVRTPEPIPEPVQTPPIYRLPQVDPEEEPVQPIPSPIAEPRETVWQEDPQVQPPQHSPEVPPSFSFTPSGPEFPNPEITSLPKVIETLIPVPTAGATHAECSLSCGSATLDIDGDLNWNLDDVFSGDGNPIIGGSLQGQVVTPLFQAQFCGTVSSESQMGIAVCAQVPEKGEGWVYCQGSTWGAGFRIGSVEGEAYGEGDSFYCSLACGDEREGISGGIDASVDDGELQWFQADLSARNFTFACAGNTERVSSTLSVALGDVQTNVTCSYDCELDRLIANSCTSIGGNGEVIFQYDSLHDRLTVAARATESNTGIDGGIEYSSGGPFGDSTTWNVTVPLSSGPAAQSCFGLTVGGDLDSGGITIGIETDGLFPPRFSPVPTFGY